MVRNAGPPNTQRSSVVWTPSGEVAERSPVLAPLVVSTGVAAFGFLSYLQERFGRRPVVLDGQ
jgi:hypothetical protein